MHAKTILTVAVMLMAVTPGIAQEESAPPPPPCSAEEFSQFDFWIGEWDLTWGEGENAGSGTNVITREMGGCVIEENFTTHDEEPFIGNSLSVYRPSDGKWYQTWVDNHGGYLDFTGNFKDGKMILSREAERKGEKFLQRMVFHDIEENSLTWNWEKSTDGGKSWELLWQIHYKRKQ